MRIGKPARTYWQTRRQTLATLRAEVTEKKNRLQSVARHPKISPALLAFLEGHPEKCFRSIGRNCGSCWTSGGTAPRLRHGEKTGAQKNWIIENSGIPNSRYGHDARITGAFTPGEIGDKLASKERCFPRHKGPSVLNPAETLSRNTRFLRRIRPRIRGLSNYLVTQITGAIGPERTGLIFPGAWYELSSAWRPSTAETMTIRQTMVNGQPDLSCE